MSKVVREKEMSVSAQSLWKVITDFSKYPEFVDEVVAAKSISPARSDGEKVIFELEVVKRFQYTLEFHRKEGTELSWRLLESNFFKKNEGRWVLRELSSGRTHVLYEVEVAFGFLVPGWVTKKLTEVNLPKMFEAFETRAKEVQ